MPQYPINNKITACNTQNCQRCRNKYSCNQYIDYLENIAQLPVEATQTPISSPLPTQPLPDTKTLTSLKDSMVEEVVNKFLILESRYKILQEINEAFTNTLTNMNEKLSVVDEKFSKLDKLIAMIDTYETQNNPDNGGLSVYDSDAAEVQLKSGDIIQEKKRGFFGLGKEKDVTRVVE